MPLVYSSCRQVSAVALAVIIGLAGLAPVAAAQDGRALWTDVAATDAPAVDRPTAPLAYRTLALDDAGMEAFLAAAPLEDRPGDLSRGHLVALPLPDGTFATYRIVESPVMAPGLQARYPTIRTYLGEDVQRRGATVRISMTTHGFQAIGQRPEGTFYIDPIVQHQREFAKSYWHADLPARDAHHHPGDEVLELDNLSVDIADMIAERDEQGLPRFEHGSELRVFRTAIAANRFYTAFHSSGSPTVEEGLAAIVVAVNRLNQVYEREVASRLVLVENNDLIIYTTAADDPYGNQISSTLIQQNHTNLNQVIGSANYDVGHVFTTGGGGLAVLRSLCNNAWKGMAASGLNQPINDPFVVAIAAHEFGHQFGANHTFNGSLGSCGGNNRNAGTAYEPGSGSTIMAYAGICGLDNIQTNTDDYFHNISQTEMINHMTTGGAATCGEAIPLDHDIPDPIVQDGPQLPIETPFVFRGGANYDGDHEALTFVWEAMNLGPAGPPPGRPAWDGDPPFFRTFPPTAQSDRGFPRIDRYIRNLPHLGEGLPDATRLLRFRLTVRNNAPGGGAVRDRQITVPASGNAGPFRVTSQHLANTVWFGTQERVITWDVANTNTATFGAETVDIYLSPNRHEEFEAGTAILLAEGVPNDGSATIVVPNDVETTMARIFVKASEGFFFGFNTQDITIVPSGVTTEEDASPDRIELSPVYPNPLGVANSRATFNVKVDQSQDVRVAVYDALGREVAVLHEGPLAAGTNHQFALSPRSFSSGMYFVRAVGEQFSAVQSLTVVR
jgi:hypothetical protein